MLCNRKSITANVLVFLICLTLVFIWGNSMLGREQSADVSNGLLEFIRPALESLGLNCETDHWLRKLAHFCEFALLGAELSALWALKTKRSMWDLSRSALYCLGVAVMDETIQYFSGRYPHILDVMLDFSGSICGIAVFYAVFAAVVKYKEKMFKFRCL